MKRNNNKLLVFLASLLYSMSGLSPVWADDTEVFFGATANLNNVLPNVLFVLDTSISMGSSSGYVPGTGKTRLENMKEALQLMLDTVPDINVGLMKFNYSEGGPVLYPVRYINQRLGEDEQATSINRTIGSGADDAVERGGIVYLDDNDLILARHFQFDQLQEITVTVNSGNDDARERVRGNNANEIGNVSLTDQTLTMSSSWMHGLRFTDVGIPKDSLILEAELSLRASDGDSQDVELRFYGQNAGHAEAFSTNKRNISNRSKTTAFASYVPGRWTKDSWYTVTGLGPVISEIVSHPVWEAGNALALIQTHVGGNQRRMWSRDKGNGNQAQLKVTFAASMSAQPAKVGLRFTDVGIPQGATITSASLEFVAKSDESADMSDAPLVIEGILEADARPFQAGVADISTRSRTMASVQWTPDAWTAGTSYSTPDLTQIVQEIVNQNDWCGNNAMGFVISGEAAEAFRRAMSYEADSSLAPRLHISYEPTSDPGCMNQVLVYRISDSKDDAHKSSSNSVNTNSSSVSVSASNGYEAGFRFRDVRIRNNAEILEAYLTLTASNNGSGDVTGTIKGERVANSSAFGTNGNNISSRPRTNASVSWSMSPWQKDQSYRSPDLSAIIKEVVSQEGWSAGNALTLILSADGSRSAYSWDGKAMSSAVLTIKVRQSEVVYRTVRDLLKEEVAALSTSGYTPAVEAYYEALRYYRGESVDYGKRRGDNHTSERVSHPLSWTGGRLVRDDKCTDANLNSSACTSERIEGDAVYISPITDACQANFIVLLTDGEANSNEVQNRAKQLMGKTTNCTSASSGELCARDLAEWAYTADHSDINGTQFIRTYTIGFNLDEGGNAAAIRMLQDMADKGGGRYSSASTAQELAAVFRNIIDDVLKTDTTFVSPGVAVNQFNRLQHQDQIYFSLFRPERSMFWSGNLKRYRLDPATNKLKDRNNQDAVDPNTGFFVDTAASYWPDAANLVDGGDVTKGGAAAQLPAPDNRKVYTYLGGNKALTAAENKVHEDTAGITKELLGIGSKSDAYRTWLLKWARGVDIGPDGTVGSDSGRKEFADPLHSVPVIVTYGDEEATHQNILFFGTNDGFLHAVDASNGRVRFSFIPRELLTNLDYYFRNPDGVNRIYGMDGPITVWKQGTGDDAKVYLVAGMRRGGRNYYALDVTNPDAPRFEWMIEGGSDNFKELGQTWSRPIPTRVKIGANTKTVLIFAGGYDPGQDDHLTRTADTYGRAIYIVDAKTGAKLWSAGPTALGFDQQFADMQYSIPGDLRVLDIDGDGLADRIYMADVGGQVWRFDINNGAAASQLMKGGVIARLSGEDAQSNRRFYYAPDVALISVKGDRYISIAIGSGFREHPLNTTIQDRFYVLRDRNVFTAPASYVARTEADLYDATDNLIGQGTAEQQSEAQVALKNAHGWYIRLTNRGEKVLASAATVDRKVLFTTFQPDAQAIGTCSAGYGLGRYYALNVHDATPVLDINGDGQLTSADRSQELKRGGIPPEPTVLLPGNGDTLIMIGPETVPLDVTVRNPGTYWRQD